MGVNHLFINVTPIGPYKKRKIYIFYNKLVRI